MTATCIPNASSISFSVTHLLASHPVHSHRSPSVWFLSTVSNPRRCSITSINNNGRKSNFSLMATAGENVEPTLVPKSVPVTEAYLLQQSGHKYLDVRTPEEFSAGHAVGAINVPYLFRHESGGMVKNNSFLDQVLSHFNEDDEIVVGCQLGKRSVMAAADLLSNGFTGVTDIAGGYAAWTQNGLPIKS